MATPAELLNIALQQVQIHPETSFLTQIGLESKVEFICRNLQNRACVRFLMACCLAKIHKPDVDIRKPYTEIGDADTYSGRTYDERYITAFIIEHRLPCNLTTAFLTPAFRNINRVLTPDLKMAGRPESLYRMVLEVLTDIQVGTVTASGVLQACIRWLIIIRDEANLRMESLIAGLRATDSTQLLSSEHIVTLVDQHLKIGGSSRLPVLIVAAAYKTIEAISGEQLLPLQRHNAADEQTGALGDLEITLVDDARVVTSYEMKTRRITQNDIDQALQKLNKSHARVDNYIFITTERIDDAVRDYAAGLYDKTGGIEIVVLDCIGFLRYFLHLFHRLRGEFLNIYQAFVLAEPDSAVSQPLKEAFLALRQAAESSLGNSANE
jgi:hypothetical protein